MIPELLYVRCDHCPNIINKDGVARCNVGRNFGDVMVFKNHTEAYQLARKKGWYIAEVELCPVCAEAYAVEKSSEEEAE